MEESNTQTTDRPQSRRTTLYTFGGVFLAVLTVGLCAAPWVLRFAESTYLELLDGVNERQARAMARFVDGRLASGLSLEEVAQEFQEAIEGSQTDLGYVCLIERDEVRYVSHPDIGQLGMEVKPGARFTPAFSSDSEEAWRSFIQRGETHGGHLSFGPQMSQERVHFRPVTGTNWTISTHENLARIEDELRQLRRALGVGALLLSLLVAVPASLAARAVSRRRELQIHQQAEIERRVLAEESARKSEELDQARRLQLALLPQELPQLADLRMAAHMQTATEVGGDYYDVAPRENGALTFTVGDATGHGLKAGMMVFAVKSLFAHFAGADDLLEALYGMARALRRSRPERLNMALALGRIERHRLTLAGAGMPPAWIFRSGTGRIESVALSGVPLGSPIEPRYERSETDLTAGDVVLLSSDGFAELAGPGGEQLGYERAEELFRQAATAERELEAVLARLLASVEDWSQGQLDDDVTLLLLQAV